MDSAQISTLLNAAGVTTMDGGINWANLIAGLIFGMVGFVAFMRGKKEKNSKYFAIGLTLMVYPYFVSNTILLYSIGVVLTAALYFWRD